VLPWLRELLTVRTLGISLRRSVPIVFAVAVCGLSLWVTAYAEATFRALGESLQPLSGTILQKCEQRTPEVQAWLTAHPKVHLHYTPTSASWLNQVEGFFGILAKQSLRLADHGSKQALREHLAAYMRGWNQSPTPFVWTKPAAAIIRSHRRMLEHISTAVH